MKLKKCKNCPKTFTQYKSTDKYCSFKCAKKKYKPIKAISTKRKAQRADYKSKRDAYMHRNPLCAACKRADATEVHHKFKTDGERLNDEFYWMAVCRDCHNEIHDNPLWAIDKGFLISFVKK